MSRPVRRQLGFTLVEVLVAVLVFGLVAAITYGGLDALTQASGEHTTRANEFAELQRAVAALDRDLRQLVSRPVRQADNSIAPALAAQVNGFAATRAGWVNPGSQRRGQLQRFAWQLQGEQLIR
ncbi:MAG: type II secretion system minor pseudopilin GspJ, partial [Pseudomonadota bacterium]